MADAERGVEEEAAEVDLRLSLASEGSAGRVNG